FQRGVAFHDAVFRRDASFGHAEFHGDAYFDRARFAERVQLDGAGFTGDARWAQAQFEGELSAEGTRFGRADFPEARFAVARQVGPLIARRLVLDRAAFAGSVRLAAAAAEVSCAGTRFEAGATMRLRYAVTDLQDAVFAAPSTVAGSGYPIGTDVLPL